MKITRVCALALTAGAAMAVAGCTDDYGGYGYGYARPYAGGYYGGPYAYDSYYDGYGYGSPWGWYDNFYYPGVGFYIYDRSGSRHRWNDAQQRYWTSRSGSTYNGQPNWSQFRNYNGAGTGTYSGRTWNRGGTTSGTTGGTYSGRTWNGGGTAGRTYGGQGWGGHHRR